MIRINLGRDPAAKLRFTYSPLSEAVLALEALTNPKRHPDQLRWVLATKPVLPSELWREIRSLAFAYKTWQPGMFSPTPEDDLPTFAEELHRLRSLPLTTFVADLARAVTPEAFPGFPSAAQVLSDPAVQALLLSEARRMSPLYAPAIPLLWTDPEGLRGRLITLLQVFWDACFAQKWQEIEPLLADSIVECGAAFQRSGLYRLLQPLLKGCRLLRRENAIVVPRGPDTVVNLDEHPHLLLVPSCFTWTFTRVECDSPYAPSLIYPVADPEAEGPALPPELLAKVLGALGHETRLQILQACAQVPRSTQEVAGMVGLSEGGISRHLQQLQAAGLVVGRRRSYYVLYKTNLRQVRAISPALLRYLGER